jgi:hypothetical protein
VALGRNDDAAALEHFRRAVAAQVADGNVSGQRVTQTLLAQAALRCGDRDLARTALRNGLAASESAGDTRMARIGILVGALAAVVDGDLRRAAVLHAAAASGGPAVSVAVALNDEVERAIGGLGPTDLDECRRTGASMPLPDAVRLAAES